MPHAAVRHGDRRGTRDPHLPHLRNVACDHVVNGRPVPAGSTSPYPGPSPYGPTRAPRRLAATPGVPRAGRYFPPEEVARRTFGAVLDTSGSMGRTLLGEALGAIASRAGAPDVPAARVVFCDAAPHDAGYLPVPDLAGRVRAHGRGGTVPRPGVGPLRRADGFPPAAPVPVSTGGWCDYRGCRASTPAWSRGVRGCRSPPGDRSSA
ncbi:hypothetical protein B1H29_06470 [Streptomyces pactum]|uniref:VWA domain-containing protein n=1 Tax=Streptomyces pactum TaxID=68249 RepID=A0A1S6J4D6_9ACTN|nr:hypothetical protein B1H29_06470 [Streptomyces pactum]